MYTPVGFQAKIDNVKSGKVAAPQLPGEPISFFLYFQNL